MKKKDLILKKFALIYPGLELAIGIVFSSQTQPKLINHIGLSLGELPSWNPRGLNGRPKKFYAPLIEYSRDNSLPEFHFYIPLWEEEYGELVFHQADDTNQKQIKKIKILFGRNNEEEPFTFAQGKKHLPLRIYRQSHNSIKKWQFNPLFVQISYPERKEIHLIKIDIQWIENKVRVCFKEPTIGLPLFLRI